MARSPALDAFVGLMGDALADALPASHAGHRTGQRMRQALSRPATSGFNLQPHSLPVCAHLPAALQTLREAPLPQARHWADAFAALVPALAWQRSERAGSQAFHAGHANTQVVGPQGLEQRSDLVLGASLLAPHTVYPDHSHPPEEIYRVLSDGDWYRAETGWTTPGIGGSVHHPPGILHAMRAGPRPLLAVWCLWVGDAGAPSA